MILRMVALALLLNLAPPTEISSLAERLVPESCPTTKPSDHPFVAPPPYRRAPSIRSFWFGTDRFWTVLPKDATWGMGAKTFWWRQDWARYREIPEKDAIKLTVTARRLDGLTPAPKIGRANRSYQERDGRRELFLVGFIDFSSPGCWEIAGKYEEDELRFVVWVRKHDLR